MSENKFINVEFNVLDFDECISKAILYKNISLSDSDASKATEKMTNRPETLLGLENTIPNNPHQLQVNCKIKCEDNNNNSLSDVNQLFKETNSLKPDSEIDHSETANNLCKKKENITNDAEQYCKNNEISANDSVSIIYENSSLTDELNAELINMLSPKNCNGPTDQNYDSDGSGYLSSDFEFITESEAKIEGLINNIHSKNLKRTSTITSRALFSSLNSIPTSNSISDARIYFDVPRRSDQDIMTSSRSDLVESGRNSSTIGSNNLFKDSLEAGPSSSYSRLNYEPCRDSYGTGPSSSNIFQNDPPVHNAVPDGEEYFDLFRGIYDPVLPLSTIHMMENKAFRTTSMNVEFEGLGFDMRLMRNMDGSSQDELESEAEENAKKILQMYPVYNRRRRRRH